MYICRVQIQNFRNFKHLDVQLAPQTVIVGENKIGKTNFIHALRLVLDPTLPDSARQLLRTDFWDGLGDSLNHDDEIFISVELTDFEDNENLLAVLAEHITQPIPMVSTLSYIFRVKPSVTGNPQSENDYEFISFGGNRIDNRFGYEVRSRIPLDVLPALRDAERDLNSWRLSPLRPLLDRAASKLERGELRDVAEEVLASTQKVLQIPSATQLIENPVTTPETDKDDKQKPLLILERQIVDLLTSMVGNAQTIDAKLGFSPTDPDRLIRAIRIFVDGGKRNVRDASLGSANLLYLGLKSLELEQLAELSQRDHTFLAIEEPEAHIHPHLQRLVYRKFLRQRAHKNSNSDDEGGMPKHQSVMLTTHSPHIVSVSPLRSIVLLKHSGTKSSTTAVSTAKINLTNTEIEDLERYIDITRGEILFARGVLLVEGDAEEYLVPALAHLLGYDLDQLGISICSIAGTNFTPYVKLLGKQGLDIPFAVLTDYDPQDDGDSLGLNRIEKLLSMILGREKYESLAAYKHQPVGEENGLFLNKVTLEVDLFLEGQTTAILETFRELSDNKKAIERMEGWVNEPDTLDRQQYLNDIKAIGKGRFAQRLANHLEVFACPSYIEKALKYVTSKIN